jgi:cytochrome c
MPAHPNLTDGQRESIAAWILVQKTAPVTASVAADFSPFAEGKPGKVTRDVFHGYQFYNSYCYRCHGTDATGGQLAPDLRRTLSTGMDQKGFLAVAMTGKTDKGMPSWAGFLTEQDITDIYKYVKARSLNLIPVGRPASEQDQ